MSKSSFDKLAPEEFLRIFELSDNPALIFASDYYHNLVNKHDFVRKRLIQLCCTDDRLRQHKANPAHYSLRLLLQEKWLSLGWLLEAQNTWLADRSEEFVREWFSRKKLLSADQIDAVVENVRTVVEKKDQQLDPDMLQKPGQLQQSVSTRLPITGDRSLSGFSVDIKISSSGACGLQLAIQTRPRDADPDSWDGDHRAWFHFDRFIGCLGALPSRLLRGPWTQEQGDILAYFFQWLEPHHRSYPKHIADASAGLMQAIKTRNLVALCLLGGSLKMAFRKHRSSLQPKCFGLWEAPIISNPFVPSRFQDQSSWVCIRAPQCRDWGATTLNDWLWTKAHLDELLLWLWDMYEDNEPLVYSLACHCKSILCGWEYGTDSWDESGERNFYRLGHCWYEQGVHWVYDSQHRKNRMRAVYASQ